MREWDAKSLEALPHGLGNAAQIRSRLHAPYLFAHPSQRQSPRISTPTFIDLKLQGLVGKAQFRRPFRHAHLELVMCQAQGLLRMVLVDRHLDGRL